MIFRKFFLMNFLVNITKDWLIWFNFFFGINIEKLPTFTQKRYFSLMSLGLKLHFYTKAACWPAHTYVDKFVVVPLSQVMEYRGIVKVCQVGHILSFFVFGRVDLLKLILLEVFGLFSDICFGLWRSVKKKLPRDKTP